MQRILYLENNTIQMKAKGINQSRARTETKTKMMIKIKIKKKKMIKLNILYIRNIRTTWIVKWKKEREKFPGQPTMKTTSQWVKNKKTKANLTWIKPKPRIKTSPKKTKKKTIIRDQVLRMSWVKPIKKNPTKCKIKAKKTTRKVKNS